jgi:hypothetical protein
MNVVPGLLLAATALCAQPRLDFLNHGRPMLDAHNCYPYDGRWADRIDRALSAGSRSALSRIWLGISNLPLERAGLSSRMMPRR